MRAFLGRGRTQHGSSWGSSRAIVPRHALRRSGGVRSSLRVTASGGLFFPQRSPYIGGSAAYCAVCAGEETSPPPSGRACALGALGLRRSASGARGVGEGSFVSEREWCHVLPHVAVCGGGREAERGHPSCGSPASHATAHHTCTAQRIRRGAQGHRWRWGRGVLRGKTHASRLRIALEAGWRVFCGRRG
jgi:hypothetical protein